MIPELIATALLLLPLQLPDVQAEIERIVGGAQATESPQAPATPEPAAIPPPPAPAPPPPTPATYDAIPRYVVMCESGGSYTAQNPRSSASGKYQMIQSTANGAARAIGRPDLVGVPARLWPPAVQDQAAAWLWDGGRGRGHWRACL